MQVCVIEVKYSWIAIFCPLNSRRANINQAVGLPFAVESCVQIPLALKLIAKIRSSAFCSYTF